VSTSTLKSSRKTMTPQNLKGPQFYQKCQF
jgi:hypothetical protein